MHVVDNNWFELAAYQLKGVVRLWFDQRGKNRGVGAPVLTRAVFDKDFLGALLPQRVEGGIREF